MTCDICGYSTHEKPSTNGRCGNCGCKLPPRTTTKVDMKAHFRKMRDVYTRLADMMRDIPSDIVQSYDLHEIYQDIVSQAETFDDKAGD